MQTKYSTVCIPLMLEFLMMGNIAAVFAQAVYKEKYTVAQDGSGDYKTLQEAINACKVFPDGRITIYLKPGIYHEKVEIHSWTNKISLIGEDAATTIISFDDYSGKGSHNTFTSYTVKVSGSNL